MTFIIFVCGAIVGFLAKYLWEVKTDKNLQFSWVQYLLIALWVLWVGFGIVFVGISIGEYESRAASLGGIIFGGVAILALIVMRISYLRNNKMHLSDGQREAQG